jgi:Uncharacterized protein conserved in bacteria (DUF2130)
MGGSSALRIAGRRGAPPGSDRCEQLAPRSAGSADQDGAGLSIPDRHEVSAAVEAVIEKFNDMRDDLDKERKFMGRQWAKRETQILAVVESTVGMVGDLQAIAGKAMPEIPSLDMPLLESVAAPERKVG